MMDDIFPLVEPIEFTQQVVANSVTTGDLGTANQQRIQALKITFEQSMSNGTVLFRDEPLDGDARINHVKHEVPHAHGLHE
jgi:hypothetical protein